MKLAFKPIFKLGDIIEIDGKKYTILGYYSTGYFYSGTANNMNSPFLKKHGLTGMIKVDDSWDNHSYLYINENTTIIKCLKDY